MSVEERKRIEVLAAALVALIAVASALGAFVVLPYRMTAAEVAIKEVQTARAMDHDILTRVDARTEEMSRALTRLEKKP